MFVNTDDDARAVSGIIGGVDFANAMREALFNFGFKTLGQQSLVANNILILSARDAKRNLPPTYSQGNGSETLSMVAFLSSAILSVILIIALGDV